MKKILTNKKLITFIFFVLSFLAIDVAFRFFIVRQNPYYSIFNIAPLFFDLSIILITFLIYKLLPKKAGIIWYVFTITLNLILGLVQYFHYRILNDVFSFSELFLAGEGLDFISSITAHITLKIVLVIIVVILLTIFTVILMVRSTKEKETKKGIIIKIAIIITSQLLGMVSLCIFNNGYKINNENSPFYHFKTYSVANKSIQVTGILQYNIQDIIMYYYNQILDEKNKEVYGAEITDFINDREKEEVNEYTGKFEDKNLIYIMLESIDDWVITEETMPTLYKMQNEGWNFTNRYAPQFYSGYTFNSEFAANTGLYLMDSYSKYINNSFPHSLPNLFKEAGYSVNSYHMNDVTFYNRNKYHETFGYEKIHGGYYVNKKYANQGYTYINDADWINNEETYNLLVNKEEKFMSFLITYSGHMPYSTRNLKAHYGFDEKIEFNNSLEEQIYCIKYQAAMTDKMLELLLERLEEDDLLEDTVIVLFTDHYAYGFTDTNYLMQQKNVTNEVELQKTPLIIWNSEIKHKDIDTYIDTADLVPTIANLFNLDYDANNYLSTDAFSSKHDNYVYFKDGMYIDEKNVLLSGNKDVDKIIKINKYIFKTDYYK